MDIFLIAISLLPLAGGLFAGLIGPVVGRTITHSVSILTVVLSCVLSFYVLWLVWNAGGDYQLKHTLYNWVTTGGISLNIGFMVDRLAALMLAIVNFVSLAVHIYTIGYMQEDKGYIRFFSYISVFTFAMNTLVLADNFLLLFFGWEGVGLISYLLIGFWYQRESAVFANLKAFIINRVGDFGFLLGIAGVLMYFNTLDYQQVFAAVPAFAEKGLTLHLWGSVHVDVLTLICVLLFAGAMGKSAQVPLHTWLPDSMEGPTPISALIHAATMVTAGVYMVARLSPMYSYAPGALNVVLVVGATTCFFMALLGVIQNDIKRIIAYCTLSQLGYMVTALGVGAYSLGVFHLMSHAAFKALMFLAAGAVIVMLHHEQNIWKMGALRRYMPISYVTMLLGCLSLIAFPGFSGFFSKDSIIEVVHMASGWGTGYAYFCVLTTAFITALYTFRMFFVCFHTQARMDEKTRSHLKEAPAVMWVPLVALAVPAVFVGALFYEPILHGFFGIAVKDIPGNALMATFAQTVPSAWTLLGHVFMSPAFYLAALGVFTAWLCYVKFPRIPQIMLQRASWLHTVLKNAYYFDHVYQYVFAAGARLVGQICWRIGDVFIIDDGIVNGTASRVQRIARAIRGMQTGMLYHYAFAMVVGLFILFLWFFLPR